VRRDLDQDLPSRSKERRGEERKAERRKESRKIKEKRVEEITKALQRNLETF
jgi:hypothetical protein